MLMRAAAKNTGWNLNYGGIALMWRGGCIIRSAFLGKIKEAFDTQPEAGQPAARPVLPEGRRAARRPPGGDVVADRRRARHPGPGLQRGPGLLTTATAAPACRPTCSRPSATTSAPTPTSASTSRAASSSTPTGPATAARRRPRPIRRKPTPGTPGCPWGPRPWPTCFGSATEAQPAKSQVARPRPFRALGRPRLDAALFDAARDGYDLSLDDLKNFRQMGAAGHPESFLTPGSRLPLARWARGQQRRGHGHRGTPSGRALQPTGPPRGGSFHLRLAATAT